ncbi:MAG: putative Fe-S cluster assembly protein SufT [Verrucomicrobia bacterium]|nr:putative Fe-S cluster assembly protein SufT [Verrucomicrobiota bacterium]
MQDGETITLNRDCEAVLIPAGIKTTLPVGSSVVLTQSLGGSYTVSFGGGLARIDGKDADAIGKTAASAPQSAPQTAAGPVDEKLVWDQMRTCFDPEIPVNIVDLGLVYDCKIIPLPENGNRVEVKMTLTAPGCGMGAFIASDVDHKIRAVPGVADVKVDLVWDPVWNQGMMTEAARLQLGLM